MGVEAPNPVPDAGPPKLLASIDAPRNEEGLHEEFILILYSFGESEESPLSLFQHIEDTGSRDLNCSPIFVLDCAVLY